MSHSPQPVGPKMGIPIPNSKLGMWLFLGTEIMFFTGIDFNKNGVAYISTLMGEVYKVTNLHDNSQKTTWQKIATGLNQPFGVHVDDDGIFVLGRGQITRLHDTNGDGEADFYECFTSGFGGYDRSHTHAFGLERTGDGNFHFVVRDGIFKTLPDGTTLPVASGVRNCMGLGADPGNNIVLVAPQEGTWTPASAIIEVRRAEDGTRACHLYMRNIQQAFMGYCGINQLYPGNPIPWEQIHESFSSDAFRRCPGCGKPS